MWPFLLIGWLIGKNRRQQRLTQSDNTRRSNVTTAERKEVLETLARIKAERAAQ